MSRNRQPHIVIVPAKAIHVRDVARRMRKADCDEVFASSGKQPFDALAFTLRRSAKAWTALVDGRPEVMFGVADLNILAGVGAPWLLGTDAVETHARAFLRNSVMFQSQLLDRYLILKNFVDDRNKASIRWLKWLGFSIGEPFDWNGYAFRLFELRSADVRFDDGFDTGVNGRRRYGADPAG